MKFHETELPGAYIIEIEKFEDDRGFFARGWCQREFSEHGLETNIAQANISYNKKKGTLRGFHYQSAPHQEVKIIRCIKGALYDAIIDLRPKSPTYKKWIGVELTGENHRMLYVPKDFAHAFQTLEDDTEAFYQVTQFYTPGAEKGIRWNDPAFNVKWPEKVEVISDKDANWPDFQS